MQSGGLFPPSSSFLVHLSYPVITTSSPQSYLSDLMCTTSLLYGSADSNLQLLVTLTLRMNAAGHFLLRLVLILLLLGAASVGGMQRYSNGNGPATASTLFRDPDSADSEFNHHCAGYILIAVAVMMLAGEKCDKLRFLQAMWPVLFTVAGLLLVAWSDKEIWPRGFLNWTWLIHHDAEARQHKIYGLLLIVMGFVEHLRWRQKLSRFWETWAFPVLACFGAVFLLFHAHGGTSGLPAGWDKLSPSQKAAFVAAVKHGDFQTLALNGSNTHSRGQNSESVMHGKHSGMEAMHDMMSMGNAPHPANSAADLKSSPSTAAVSGTTHLQQHAMTPVMLLIRQQHIWFTVVGLAIALFKFAADGRFWSTRPIRCLWPGAMTLLGILLVLYHE